MRFKEIAEWRWDGKGQYIVLLFYFQNNFDMSTVAEKVASPAAKM